MDRHISVANPLRNVTPCRRKVLIHLHFNGNVITFVADKDIDEMKALLHTYLGSIGLRLQKSRTMGKCE